jgi:hypothetical protein
MLGTEYNWLIEAFATANGGTKIRLASNVLFTLGIAVYCFLCVALQAAPARDTIAGNRFISYPGRELSPTPVSTPAARDVISLSTSAP